MAEYASFIRERRELTTQIAQAEDPEQRRVLELRQEIYGPVITDKGSGSSASRKRNGWRGSINS